MAKVCYQMRMTSSVMHKVLWEKRNINDGKYLVIVSVKDFVLVVARIPIRVLVTSGAAGIFNIT
jgi:hypothetical protein